MPEISLVVKQSGAKILPDNSTWQHRMEIKSQSSSRLYVVAQNKANDIWGCSCPGWKAHRNCKHLKTMKPMLASAGFDVLSIKA